LNEAEENAEIVRRAYAAFNAADMKTLTETFDERRGKGVRALFWVTGANQ
jgi:hypothetical protein